MNNSQTPQALSQHKRWLKAGLLGGLSLLALVVVAAQFRSEPAAAGAPAPGFAATPPQAASLPLSTPVAAIPVDAVRWQGSELRIDFDEVPLAQAIALLARATHSTVNGVQWPHKPTPVTLHRRTSDVATAWQHLLQGHAAFSITCSASNCQVWITSEIAAPAAAAAPHAEQAPPAPADAAADELEASQPGGAC